MVRSQGIDETMMRSFLRIQDFQEFCRTVSRPLGLVPTMGALHEGHLSLIRQAKLECESVAVSIFVNPKQFGPNEDIDAYPRQLLADVDLLGKEGADAVFTPTIDEIYPSGFSTTVSVEGPALGFEGEIRPNHFAGVSTVVTKLFLASLPELVYFGAKDAQQVAVIRRLVKDLKFPLEVREVPTLREPNGLAISSRNVYLSSDEHLSASVLYRALQEASRIFQDGERDINVLIATCRKVLVSEPKVVSIDYVDIVDPNSFERLETLTDGPALMTLAVRLGPVRLIDNLILQFVSA